MSLTLKFQVFGFIVYYETNILRLLYEFLLSLLYFLFIFLRLFLAKLIEIIIPFWYYYIIARINDILVILESSLRPKWIFKIVDIEVI